MDPSTVRHIEQGLILYLILCGSVALHEYGHAKAADKLGDPLPRLQGRVTLNPFAHLDPIGTGLIPLVTIFFNLPFAIIGWGKPVQISLPNPATRMRDDMLITIAGPAMNALIALGATLLHALVWHMPETPLFNLIPLLDWVVELNCMLIAFNLIPIPPLDGSHFLRYLIGMSDEAYLKFSMNGWWILLILINVRQFQEFLGQLIVWAGAPFGALLNLLTR